MSESIQHFLLVFDHAKGELVEVQEFGSDAARALAAYAEKERDLRTSHSLEIVLVGSDSYDTVRVTHANYFADAAATSKYLVGV
ncbi:MAG TPA: hypothetical protein VMV23_10630 [Candidatus Nanopelagicaceae bacterium]|nr:hypothetical protein [Candidatus Nanopelagicaceae bacterium]